MVTARHPGRLRRSVSAAHVQHSWDYLCGRAPSPWLAPLDLEPPAATTVAWEKEPAQSSSDIVQKNPSNFWTTFNPELDVPTPDDIYPDDLLVLDELRWRSAPWGQDDWEADDPVEDDPSDDEEQDQDQDNRSEASDVSEHSTEDFMSGIPLKLKLLPGKIHLLHPKVHRLPVDSTYDESRVNTATPIQLRSGDGKWYFKTLSEGIHLPRPKDAPATFRKTKPSPLMDTVIARWIDNGLLA